MAKITDNFESRMKATLENMAKLAHDLQGLADDGKMQGEPGASKINSCAFSLRKQRDACIAATFGPDYRDDFYSATANSARGGIKTPGTARMTGWNGTYRPWTQPTAKDTTPEPEAIQAPSKADEAKARKAEKAKARREAKKMAKATA